MQFRFPLTTRGRAAALTVCLAAAAAAAIVQRQRLTAGNPPAAAAAVGADSILAGLPAVNASLESGRARALAADAVRRQPGSADAWIALADTLAQELRDTADQSLYGHAELACGEALRLAPDRIEAMTGMAWVLGGRHQFEESMAWAGRALAIRPDSPEALGIVGDAQQELGRYDEALESYQKMMDARPDLSSWSRGARLLWITGNKSKAIWLMERAIRAGAPYAENTAWCRAELAMMLFNDGALLPAGKVIEPALAAGCRNARLLLVAGRIAAAGGDAEAAMRHCQEILKGGPHHDALVLTGDLHAAAGRMDEAEKCYREVEALHARHAASGVHDHMAMAKFLADHERNPVEALRLAEQAKLTRNVLEADVLAWVYYRNRDVPSAVNAIKRALSRGTPDAAMRYHAGMIAAAAGDRVSARKHLQAALSFNPAFDLLQAPVALRTLEQLSSSETAQANPAVSDQ